MYKILVVDDEKKEREGIRLLIQRYGFELKVTTAANGEEALQLFEHNHFDILLTDIKMPYMDGIQLIRNVQKRGANPVCIIYSAYGEFEYAKNAISLGVMEYLLKPVQLEAFAELFQKVIGLCDAREESRRKKEEIVLMQEEAASQRLGWNLLNYLESEDDSVGESESSIQKKWGKELFELFDPITEVCIPIVISSYSNMFTIEWEEYRKEIEGQFGSRTIILNHSDNQILVLLMKERGTYRLAASKKCCNELIRLSRQKYQVELFVVLGKEAGTLEELKREFNDVKEQLDYQFFISESMLLVHDESYFLKKENDTLGLYFERIFNCAKMSDYAGMKKEFEKVFSYIMQQTGFSSIYIKYTFTDAIKKISEYTQAGAGLIEYIERIYQARAIEELSGIIVEALDEMQKSRAAEHNENRLVRMAKDIVYEKYDENDMNVSYIAEVLHVSPAYLSSLYKIETGQNLVKFITKYRVEKSKELLLQTNMRVSDVAEKVGYLNVSYYISIFRSHEGCSPKQYREGGIQSAKNENETP